MGSGVVAQSVEGQVMDGTIEPGAGLLDGIAEAVEFEESILDHILGLLGMVEEAHGVGVQGTFQMEEQGFDRAGWGGIG